MGGSAVKAIVAGALAPGLWDRYLARRGFDSQQMPDLPLDPDRPDNLFDPVPTLAATHGRFDEGARARSRQLWATTHRRSILVALTGAAVAAGVGRLRR